MKKGRSFFWALQYCFSCNIKAMNTVNFFKTGLVSEPTSEMA